MSDQNFYTIAEAHSITKILERRLRRWCADGVIDCDKKGSAWCISKAGLERAILIAGGDNAELSEESEDAPSALAIARRKAELESYEKIVKDQIDANRALMKQNSDLINLVLAPSYKLMALTDEIVQKQYKRIDTLEKQRFQYLELQEEMLDKQAERDRDNAQAAAKMQMRAEMMQLLGGVAPELLESIASSFFKKKEEPKQIDASKSPIPLDAPEEEDEEEDEEDFMPLDALEDAPEDSPGIPQIDLEEEEEDNE